MGVSNTFPKLGRVHCRINPRHQKWSGPDPRSGWKSTPLRIDKSLRICESDNKKKKKMKNNNNNNNNNNNIPVPTITVSGVMSFVTGDPGCIRPCAAADCALLQPRCLAPLLQQDH